MPSSNVVAAAAMCGVPANIYMYLASPGYTSEESFCSFVSLAPAAGSAPLTASYSSNMFACGSAGFGALVVCA